MDKPRDRSRTGDGTTEELAAAVRDACVETIKAAYEDAGIRGLCGEGQFEAAIDALRRTDIHQILSGRHPARRG